MKHVSAGSRICKPARVKSNTSDLVKIWLVIYTDMQNNLTHLTKGAKGTRKLLHIPTLVLFSKSTPILVFIIFFTPSSLSHFFPFHITQHFIICNTGKTSDKYFSFLRKLLFPNKTCMLTLESWVLVVWHYILSHVT